MKAPPSGRARLALRALAILLITAWLSQGPIRANLLGPKKGTTWTWAMFHNLGKKTCDPYHIPRSALGERPFTLSIIFSYVAILPPRAVHRAVDLLLDVRDSQRE